ncbi:MAG: hypothetical protein LBL52_03620 [Rickettsiales bacterium]|jgi:hypothetical protein|nr:hypothetical protein [Rickettsiales bacterium]
MTEKNESVLAMGLETSGAPSEYEIILKGGIIERDAEIDKRLAEAGFSNEQAQLVYDLAEETIVPAMMRVAAKFRASRELEKLENYFGGEDRFDEAARQISAWASKNVDAATLDALASSYWGVLALYNMMNSGEPGMLGAGRTADSATNEKKLRDMMSDPRYWRDNDVDFIKKVDDGFKNLYRA